MHTRKQWKTDYLIQIEYQFHWMVKWKQDMRGSNHSYLFRFFRHLWKLHMKNCYPVSLLTAAPRGNGDLTAPGGSKMRDPGDEVDGTQSRNQSNEPPLGNSLLFKSDLMPLYPLPFPGTQRVGVSIDWCITPTSFQIVWCFHKFYTLFYMLDTFYLSSLLPSIMYQWNRSLSIPPGQPPGHLNFWKIFVQIPPSRGQKAVQMPHHRSIPGNQMLPPPGNFSVVFMFRKLCM